MAFYHVGCCDCPSGCCDCGTAREQNVKTKLHDAFYGNYQKAVDAQEALDHINISIETLECFGSEYLHATNALKALRKKLVARHSAKKSTKF